MTPRRYQTVNQLTHSASNPVPNRHQRSPFPPSKGSKDPILAPPLTISAVTCGCRVIGTDRQILAGRRGFSCSEWAMFLKGCEGRRMGVSGTCTTARTTRDLVEMGFAAFLLLQLKTDWTLNNESVPGQR